MLVVELPDSEKLEIHDTGSKSMYRVAADGTRTEIDDCLSQLSEDEAERLYMLSVILGGRAS